VPASAKSKRRSGCPLSVSLDVFGDRWSLLIIRDLMIRGFRTFGQFQSSGEGIATNILSDRLRKLEDAGLIAAQADETDRRQINYRLTGKGIDLAPALLELLLWGARHEKTGASCALIKTMAEHREQLLAEVRRRWSKDDPTPLQVNGRWVLPWTPAGAGSRARNDSATASKVRANGSRRSAGLKVVPVALDVSFTRPIAKKTESKPRSSI
jgi:DNA-binding HxlR family transcriptional regulator